MEGMERKRSEREGERGGVYLTNFKDLPPPLHCIP